MLSFALMMTLVACATATYFPDVESDYNTIVRPQMLCVNTFVVDKRNAHSQRVEQEAAITYLNRQGFFVNSFCSSDSEARLVDIRITSSRLIIENEEIKVLWNVHSFLSLGLIPLFSEQINNITITDHNDRTAYLDQTYRFYSLSSWWLLAALPMAKIIEQSNDTIKANIGGPFADVKFDGVLFLLLSK